MAYNGYFKAYVPQILEMHDAGKTTCEIRETLHNDGPSYAMVRYILKKEKRFAMSPGWLTNTDQQFIHGDYT